MSESSENLQELEVKKFQCGRLQLANQVLHTEMYLCITKNICCFSGSLREAFFPENFLLNDLPLHEFL